MSTNTVIGVEDISKHSVVHDLDTAITQEETNYLRFTFLVLKLGTRALQQYFDTCIGFDSLAQILDGHRKMLEELKSKRVINMDQFERLYPKHGSVTQEDLDITLMIVLLRVIGGVPHPEKGWNNMPEERDHTESADIARIQFYRNGIAHSRICSLSNQTFETKWLDLEQAIIRIGGDKFIEETNSLLHSPLDRSSIDLYRHIKELEHQNKDLEKRIIILEESSASVKKLEQYFNQQNRRMSPDANDSFISPSPKDERLHIELKATLIDYLGPSVPYYQRFIARLKSYLPPVDVYGMRNDVDKILDALECKGYLDVGKYDTLIKLVHDVNIHIVTIIKQFHSQMDVGRKEPLLCATGINGIDKGSEVNQSHLHVSPVQGCRTSIGTASMHPGVASTSFSTRFSEPEFKCLKCGSPFKCLCSESINTSGNLPGSKSESTSTTEVKMCPEGQHRNVRPVDETDNLEPAQNASLLSTQLETGESGPASQPGSCGPVSQPEPPGHAPLPYHPGTEVQTATHAADKNGSTNQVSCCNPKCDCRCVI